MAVQLLIKRHMKFLDKSPKGGNRTFVCAHCGNKYNGSQTRQLAHLLGPKGKGIAVCNKFPEDNRVDLLAAANRVNGNAAGPGSTGGASQETEVDGGQSRKRFKQQELPCILKVSSLPSISNAQAGNEPNGRASLAGQSLCRPDSQQLSTAHVGTQAATAQQPLWLQQLSRDSMAERDTREEEAWALPASAMDPATGRQSSQQCSPIEDLSQDRGPEGLHCSAAPSGRQAAASAGHNSRDPRQHAPAERLASSAAPGAGSSPPVLPMRICWPARDNRSVPAAGRNAVDREAQPCRVFDCGGPAAAASAGAGALTGPVTGRQLALSCQPRHNQQQCEGGPAQQHATIAADRDSELDALQARLSKLESENQELARRLSDQTAAREEGRLRVAELSAELKVKDEHIKALLQVIKEGLIAQQH